MRPIVAVGRRWPGDGHRCNAPPVASSWSSSELESTWRRSSRRPGVVVGTATQRNTDRSTVGDTLLTISKRGALDAGCDGTPDFGFQTANVSAAPDQCVIWQLSLANQGGAVVCEVTANDAAPPFTSLDGSPSVFSQPLPGAGSCTVSGAAISCTVGNSIDRDGDGTPETHCLRGGEAAEVRFGVRLQAN